MLENHEVTQSSAQLTAVIRVTIPREEIRHVMGPGLNELISTLAAQGIAPAGPWFSHHLKMDPKIFDFEISVPVATPVKATGRVQPSQLPAAKVARAIYCGPYEGLGDAWGTFNKWIDANDHKRADDIWEVYLTSPDQNPDPMTWRTQLNAPLITS